MCEFSYSKGTKYRENKSLVILVHTELCGPLRTDTFNGTYYILRFVGDFSRFTMIYLLSSKNEVLSKFKESIYKK